MLIVIMFVAGRLNIFIEKMEQHFTISKRQINLHLFIGNSKVALNEFINKNEATFTSKLTLNMQCMFTAAPHVINMLTKETQLLHPNVPVYPLPI